MAAGVERHSAGLCNSLPLIIYLRVREADCEAQRAPVEYLILAVTLRHAQRSVFPDKGVGTRSKCGADSIAVHPLAVVDVIAEGVVHLVGKVCISALAELLADRAHLLVLLAAIPVVKHKLLGVLVEDIVADSGATAIYTVCHAVVLPSELCTSLVEKPAAR